MFLLIDAGNTRTKFGCHDGKRWLVRNALEHSAAASMVLPAGFVPTRIVIANVAGQAIADGLQRQLATWSERIEWLQADSARCGLRNHYEQPARLGADRWAAAIGAWQLLGGACLVVSAGTATTIDVVQDDGVFAGGCILPGLAMMQASLAHGTANLQQMAGHFEQLPRNTPDAMNTGCLHAQLGAIERMGRILPASSPTILTGGAAEQLASHLPATVMQRPWLVLEGLLCVAAAS